jgi:hypothetical protein
MACRLVFIADICSRQPAFLYDSCSATRRWLSRPGVANCTSRHLWTNSADKVSSIVSILRCILQLTTTLIRRESPEWLSMFGRSISSASLTARLQLFDESDAWMGHSWRARPSDVDSPWELRDANYACGQACPVNKGKGQRPPSAEDQRHLRKQSLSSFGATFQRTDRRAGKQSISVVSMLDGAEGRRRVTCSRSCPCTPDSAFRRLVLRYGMPSNY